MLFINKKEEKVKVRLGEAGKFYWVSVKPGEEVDIHKSYGEYLGLKEVKKGLPDPKKKGGLKNKAKGVLDKIKSGVKKPNKKGSEKKEDPKAKAQVPQSGPKPPVPKDPDEENKEVSYEERLKDIKGIGSETVKDILKVYPTETAMITALNNNLNLPFRNDVAEKIKEEFKK